MSASTPATAGHAGHDAELVGRARRGDAAAWDDIVDRYSGLLWWMARRHRLGPEDAADAVQVTWLRCLEHLDQLSDLEALSGWLATICRRECLRLATRRGHEIPVEEFEERRPLWGGDALGADPCDEVARRDAEERLHVAIGELPERPRTVLVALLDHDGGGYADVARRLGVPIGSLGPTRNRALARLRSDPRLVLAD